MQDFKKTAKALICITIASIWLFLTGCLMTDTTKTAHELLSKSTSASQQRETTGQATILYCERIVGIPIPFTNYQIGGLYRETIINHDDINPVPSKVIAKGAIIKGLLIVAGLAFLAIPIGIFAALYLQWRGGAILAVTGFITSLIATGSAYWFDYIVWVIAAGFLALAGLCVYYAVSRGKLGKIITELVDTSEKLKHVEKWDDSIKVELLNTQSAATIKEVVKAKHRLFNNQVQAQKREKMKKIK